MTKNELKAELDVAYEAIRNADDIIYDIRTEHRVCDLTAEQRAWYDTLCEATNLLSSALNKFILFQCSALESSEDARDYRDRILYPCFEEIKKKREQ